VLCAYCGHRVDVDLQGLGRCRIDGEARELTCPDCRAPLQRLRLGTADQAPELARCPGCLGLFLTRAALDRLLQEAVLAPSGVDHQLLGSLLQHPRHGAQETLRYRPCPACGTLMHRRLQGARSGVILDSCRDHGIWLDAGELRQLMEWRRAGGERLSQERAARSRSSEVPRSDAGDADELGNLILQRLRRWLDA
jgi:Zn-finger nucleic acid-binding protein